MSIWDNLLAVNISDKSFYQDIFSTVVNLVKNNNFSFDKELISKQKYYIVVENNRLNGYFVHVVPKAVYSLFLEMQKKIVDAPLGFSVLAGKYNNRDVGVSCFGIECSLLGKSLIKKK